MNVYYSNLKIALFTKDSDFAKFISDCLPGHSLNRTDSIPSFASAPRPDFLIVDSDGDPGGALELSEIAQNHRIPVLFFIGSHDQKLVQRAKDQGVKSVIFKGCSQKVLRDRIEDLLSRSFDPDDLPTELSFEEQTLNISDLFLTNPPALAFHLLLDYLFNL